MLGCVEESIIFILGHQKIKNGQLMLKRPPRRLSRKGFERNYKGGECRVHNQLTQNSLIDWPQGKISKIIDLLILTSQWSTFLQLKIFI